MPTTNFRRRGNYRQQIVPATARRSFWETDRQAVTMSRTHSESEAPSAMDDSYYESKKQAALRTYSEQSAIRSPFFDDEIILGPEGFAHLSFASQGRRTAEEQIRRFILLPLGLHVLKTATTAQAYRKWWTSGSKARRERIEWWAFVALFPKQDIKVRVVVRRIGGGKIHFWSVMLYEKPSRRKAPRRYSGR